MDYMEIFTLVTGVIYIILEIRQKSLMWAVGIVTSIAAMYVFFRQGLYASFGLNTYYLIMSVVGIIQWKRDKKRLGTADNGKTDEIHLNKLTVKTVVLSAAISVAGILILSYLMIILENPMSLLDACIAVLSAIATWWLAKAYLEQWWLWIIANILTTAMCAISGLWWMSILYCGYVISAVIGLVHWKRNGRYIENISK